MRQRGRVIRGALVVATLAAVLALLPAGSGARADDETALRDLTRYLLLASSGGGSDARTVDLLPAALPGDLPLGLPTPPGARLVGSAVLHTRTRTTAWDVIYDAPGTAASISDFYTDALPPLGWFAPPSEARPARGFYPAVMPTMQRGLWCGNGASLLVNTGPLASGANYVRVHVDAAGALCAVAPAATSGNPNAAEVLPGLVAPMGVPLRLTSGTFSPDRAATTATAATGMSPADLEAHYAGQLALAGWVRSDGAASGPLAWSTWMLPGAGDFRGFLSALAVSEGGDRRDLLVQVSAPAARVPGAAPGGTLPATAAPGTALPTATARPIVPAP